MGLSTLALDFRTLSSTCVTTGRSLVPSGPRFSSLGNENDIFEWVGVRI